MIVNTFCQFLLGKACSSSWRWFHCPPHGIVDCAERYVFSAPVHFSHIGHLHDMMCFTYHINYMNLKNCFKCSMHSCQMHTQASSCVVFLNRQIWISVKLISFITQYLFIRILSRVFVNDALHILLDGNDGVFRQTQWVNKHIVWHIGVLPCRLVVHVPRLWLAKCSFRQ